MSDTVISQTLNQLLHAYTTDGGIMTNPNQWPDKASVTTLLHHTRNVLFPGYFSPVLPDHDLATTVRETLGKIRTGLIDCLNRTQLVNCLVNADAIVTAFLAYLPALRTQLNQDQTAIFQGCPAATHPDEIIVAYPGFWATVVYRIAHFLSQQAVPLIPRIMTEIAHSDTGIDIHPQAQIGNHFFIDHGTGVVIGQTAIIGDYVSLYQGVTIGALRIPRRGSRPQKRHPTLEDHVTVYARTTILGGDTVIGHHSTIGGNLWVAKSVPPHTRLVANA